MESSPVRPVRGGCFMVFSDSGSFQAIGLRTGKPPGEFNSATSLTLPGKVTIMILGWGEQAITGEHEACGRSDVPLVAQSVLLMRSVAIHAGRASFTVLIWEDVTWQQRLWPASLGR